MTRIIFRSFDQEIGAVIARLEHHANAADQTAVATELLAAAEFRKKVEQKQKEDEKLSCAQWLKAADIRGIHLRQLQTRLDGTCDWIASKEAFVRWANPDCLALEDRLLLISGSHGCGKSILASSIVKRLEHDGHRNIFFTFSNSDGSRQSSEALLRTLLWQLLQSSPGSECMDIVRRLRTDGQPTVWDLWEAVGSSISSLANPVFCVIDGIDECVDFDDSMSTKIKELLEICPKLNILLLGRAHVIQAQAEELKALPFEITSAFLEQDITTLILNEISKSDILSLPALSEQITRVLKEKSDGMFLWVRLMIDDLQRSSSPFEIKERLQDLPHGLENAYRLIFLRISQKLDKFERQLTQNIFAFMIAACRPLNFDEARFAYALQFRSPEQANPPLEDFLLLKPLQKVVEILGGLVYATDGILRLSHSSVRDFLVRSEDQWVREPDLSVFRVDIADSHRALCWRCLEYLAMEKHLAVDLTTDRADTIRLYRKTYPFLEYATLYTFHHLNRSESFCSTTLAKIEYVLKSVQSIMWLETFGHLQFEDLTLAPQVDEFLDFKAKMEEMGQDRRLLAIFDQTLRDSTSQDLGSGVNKGPHTEQIRMYLEFGRDFQSGTFGQASAPSGSDTVVIPCDPRPTESDVPAPCVGSKPGSQDPIVTMSRIKYLLRADASTSIANQIEIYVRLISSLHRIRALTDPLKALFQSILKKASCIPVYALEAIGDFYTRLDKVQRSAGYI